jgi:hypothetical protein
MATLTTQAAANSEQTVTFSLTETELKAMMGLFRFFWQSSFDEDQQKNILAHLTTNQVFLLGLIYSELIERKGASCLAFD